MKVTDLLLEAPFKRHSSLARPPRFNEKTSDKRGDPQGNVSDWLEAFEKHGGFKIEQEHLDKAGHEVKRSEGYKAMIDAGYKDVTKPQSRKLGTFTFEDPSDKESPEYQALMARRGRTTKTYTIVHANGRVRRQSSSYFGGKDGDGRSPLNVPKPTIVHGDPIGSLVKTASKAMQSILKSRKQAK